MENLADVLALDQFHDDEGAAVVGVVEVIHSDRVGMTELAGDNGFGLEALQEVRVAGDGVVDNFDGTYLVEGEVAAAVDHAHAADADPAQNFILITNNHAGLQFVRTLQTCLIRWADVVVGGIRFVTGRAVFHGITSAARKAKSRPAARVA